MNRRNSIGAVTTNLMDDDRKLFVDRVVYPRLVEERESIFK